MPPIQTVVFFVFLVEKQDPVQSTEEVKIIIYYQTENIDVLLNEREEAHPLLLQDLFFLFPECMYSFNNKYNRENRHSGCK